MIGPRTLRGRLLLILLAGLVLAQALTFGAVFVERGQSMRGVMVDYLAADLASSAAMLDRLPAAERAAWLPRLARTHYRLLLGESRPQVSSGPAPSPAAPSQSASAPPAWLQSVASALAAALPEGVPRPQVLAAIGPGQGPGLALRLQDGSPLKIEWSGKPMPLSPWLIAALLLQALVLVLLSTVAVRGVTRPLERLAQAAQAWRPGGVVVMSEDGPREVAAAARAFNRMSERIELQLAERNEMLGAIAHDLQTPLTRIRLRADLAADEELRRRLLVDVDQMTHLVGQGLAYARSAEAIEEGPVPVDLAAFVQSVVDDYRDAGRAVAGGLSDGPGEPAPIVVRTRPRALRRALENLIDNALKFAGAAELVLTGPHSGTSSGPSSGPSVAIQILDRGPGIEPARREVAMQPFQRLETARNPDAPGHGLGLAIVGRLMEACGARLRLTDRPGGGLVARIELDGLPASDRRRAGELPIRAR